MITIYIRTSTKDQNPYNQLADCESIRPKLANQDTFQDYMLIEDKQSAWKDNKEREGFNRLLGLIKAKKITHLIVWDVDRIYRNRKKLVEFFQLCNFHGVTIYSYRQQFFNQLANMPKPWNEIIQDLMLQVIGWMAQDESDKKSERIKNAIRVKDNKTYSFKGNRWGRKPLPPQTRSRIIELHNQGMSIRNIAKEIKTWTNGNGKPVSKSSVHKTITDYTEEKNKVESGCPAFSQ